MKVRRLQGSIVPATNAAPKCLLQQREEPPGPEQAAPTPPCDLGPGPHHARREVGRAQRIRERKKRTGHFSVAERAAGAGEPSGWRRVPRGGGGTRRMAVGARVRPVLLARHPPPAGSSWAEPEPRPAGVVEELLLSGSCPADLRAGPRNLGVGAPSGPGRE